MNQEPTAAQTLLVTEVIACVERALAEHWQLPGNGLHERINNLRAFKVSPQVIWGLHYLRVERNRVVHHPRKALTDERRFRAVADQVLPVVERRPAPAAPLPSVDEQLRGIRTSRLQAFTQRQQVTQPPGERVALMVQAALDRLRSRHARP
jgi:hypothetical protein